MLVEVVETTFTNPHQLGVTLARKLGDRVQTVLRVVGVQAYRGEDLHLGVPPGQ